MIPKKKLLVEFDFTNIWMSTTLSEKKPTTSFFFVVEGGGGFLENIKNNSYHTYSWLLAQNIINKEVKQIKKSEGTGVAAELQKKTK